ncbi:MAG: nodulation protein NfeD [Caldilineaceae bacterium]
MTRTLLRIINLSLILLGLVSALAGNVLSALAQATPPAGTPMVYVLAYQGVVTPVLDKYIADNIGAATRDGAVAIILQLDTPGGSIDITNGITQKMLASPVPIVVYVAPSGARAGSAGTFITLAGHAAAMAPGSSIGAASPVDASGGDIGETMQAKVKNILSADIENLTQRRGEKATKWAIAAVQEAAAATADQALELGVIDFIATDVPDLLRQLDGFTVTVQGQPRTLSTGDAFIVARDLNPLQQFLNLIANPTVAALLLTLGTAGLLAEVWNPGTWIPGVTGAACLLLGLYALGQLEANFAGLGLMALAIGLFVAEAFTPTFGALTIAGAVAFVLGAVLLFDAPGIETPWFTIIGLAIFMALFTFFAGAKGLAAQRKPTMTGSEGLIGQRARVKEPFAHDTTGSVFVAGEWWNARLEAPGAVQPGEDVLITGRQGYTLLVKRVEGGEVAGSG